MSHQRTPDFEPDPDDERDLKLAMDAEADAWILAHPMCGKLAENGHGFTAECIYVAGHAGVCSWWNIGEHV